MIGLGKFSALLLVPFTLFAPLCNTLANDAETVFEIAFEKFVLDNGLRVIVHEDHKAPLVGVAVWYHVGSKDEPPGKTGFAHLFEHLMFEGTENFDREFSEPFEEAGTIQQNGTTWFDRTNYFQTVPTQALDMALWMESERMGHLLGAITQEKLDQERAVVKNEKLDGDNQPYGTAVYHILEGVFPPGHPYRHEAIGSMEDLDAASVEDVHAWFERYYGAANAVLVLAGDVTPQQGLALAKRYFGDIEPGPALSRMEAWVPERSRETREVIRDDVPHPRIYLNWAVPGRTQQDRAMLELAADVLGDGKNSRLYQALILDTQLAVDVSVGVEPHELASLFEITVTLSPGTAPESAMSIVDSELDHFFRLGPGEEELKRARAKYNASLIRGAEYVGGFSGKAALLASGEIYDGMPDFYQTFSSWINDAQPEDVRQVAANWLSDGRYRLDVYPSEDFTTLPSKVDRSLGVPDVGAPPELDFPEIKRAALTNGMEVLVARRAAVPLVNVTIQFDAGYAADTRESPGVSAFALAMMEESTSNRTALEAEAQAESLGAEINTGSSLDTSSVNLSALRQNLEPSVALFADIVRNPAFADDEVERQRLLWLAEIRSELSDPVGIALRTLPPLLYGDNHAYGIPFTGTGTAEVIRDLQRADLEAFYSDWLQADNATLFVVGDTTTEEIVPILEKYFGDWKAPKRERPQKTLTEVALPDRASFYFADRPGAPQSLVMASHLAPPTGSSGTLNLEVMNDIFGGGYNARVNQVIRIEKGWAYGAYTWLPDARGQRPWLIYAPVQTDRTADAMAEMMRMMRAYQASEPATSAELQRVVQSSTNSLPGQYETAAAVMAALLENQRFGRPDDYVTTIKSQYTEVSLEDVRESARTQLHPLRLTWVVVGDLTAIRPEIDALLENLDLGEIRMLDLEED